MKRLLLVLCFAACTRDPREGVLIEGAIAQIFTSGLGTASFEVKNLSSSQDRLRSVECTAAEDVRLHVTEFAGDVARMTEAEQGFVLPSGGALRLHAGGPHLMLYGVRLREGQLPLTLHFDRAGIVELAAPIVRSPPSP